MVEKNNYHEDALRYNALYDEAQKSAREFNELSRVHADACSHVKLAEDDAARAIEEYRDASAVLHSTARYIEELKRTGGSASVISAAHEEFYKAYNKQQLAASNLESAKSRVIKYRKKVEQSQTQVLLAQNKVREIFDRFYDVARMIERKYGLKTNKNRLLKLPVVGDGEVSLEGIEKL